MALLEWTSDLQLDIEILDEQKKLFIEYVSNFHENFQINNSIEDILSFIEDLTLFCENHFPLEEEEMINNNYYRLKYHIQSHNSIKFFLEIFKKNLTERNVLNPKKVLEDFYIMWLTNHIGGEDKVYKRFKFELDIFENRKIMGSRCEVFTLNNYLIGEGKLKKNKDGKIHIAVKSAEIIPAEANQIVKIVVYKSKKELVILFGKVFSSNLKFFIVNNPRVEYLKERRNSVRITSFLDAKIHYNDRLIPANILDISNSGILLEENRFLNLSGNIFLKIYIEDEKMNIPCYVVRQYNLGDYSMKYGCKFLFTSHEQEEWISAYMINRLAAKRMAIK